MVMVGMARSGFNGGEGKRKGPWKTRWRKCRRWRWSGFRRVAVREVAMEVVRDRSRRSSGGLDNRSHIWLKAPSRPP